MLKTWKLQLLILLTLCVVPGSACTRTVTEIREPTPCRIPKAPVAEGQLDIWICQDQGGRDAVCLTSESASKVAVLLRQYARWRLAVSACPDVKQELGELEAGFRRAGVQEAMRRVAKSAGLTISGLGE